jgi:regulator of protease activity HflC (stomatin/prohibitin superfamily)
MRIDHHAYQRATRVAALGFFLQAAVGVGLVLFALIGPGAAHADTTLLHAALYVLLGTIAWLTLIVVFNQHKLERLEALEEDELAGAGAESAFERSADDLRVAARRLQLMHRWLVPAASLAIAAGYGLLAWWMLRRLGDAELDFRLTEAKGWAVAICLGISAVAFLFSRFVAGMAKQPVWQNLRGGAAHMVGISLVTLAVAVGIGFRFFENEKVIHLIAYAIPILMIVLAGEIVLNFILHIYRPRVAGEVPRPSFDSKLLSLFAAPDNLVRTINEAVNYQFGFDVTSSWGYRLLIRSVAWLLALGAVVAVALDMIVIVEPDEQAVKLSRGRVVGAEPHGPGVMLKLPWPFQTAERHSVARVRELHLTGRQVDALVRALQQPAGARSELADVQLFTQELGRKYDRPLDPIIVRSSAVDPTVRQRAGIAADGDGPGDRITDDLALLDAEIMLQYRIRADGGLLEYLDFSDAVPRRGTRSVRDHALATIAWREVTQEFARFRVDEILGPRREELVANLRERIQGALDRQRTGVEVVAVSLPLVRPSGEAAAQYEEVSRSYHARGEMEIAARQQITSGLTQLVGDAALIEPVLAAITEFKAMEETRGPADEESIALRRAAEDLVMRGGGMAAQTIAEAERDRWVNLMSTRAEAVRLESQRQTYDAAPGLYRHRETMITYGNALSRLYKYILCVDPSLVEIDIDLRELTGPLISSDITADEGGSSP